MLRLSNIQAIRFKGPLLALAAYGSLHRRQFADLDLMVSEACLEKAAAVLRQQGFRPWRDFGCERALIHRQDGYALDLHRSVVPDVYPFGLSFSTLWARGRDVGMGNHTLRTLCDNDAFLVAVAQVGRDLFTGRLRLGKLSDLAMMMRKQGAGDRARIHALGAQQGMSRMIETVVVLNLRGATVLGARLASPRKQNTAAPPATLEKNGRGTIHGSKIL